MKKRTGRTWSSACALLALVAAVLLPGLHGMGVASACAEHGCITEAGCHGEHGHGHEDSPRHDPLRCKVCKLIELLPVSIGGRPAAGQAWWVMEPAAAMAAPVEAARARGGAVSLGARGPPDAAA